MGPVGRPRCLSVLGQMTLESRRGRNGVDLHYVTLCREVRVISQLFLVLPDFFFSFKEFFWEKINVTCNKRMAPCDGCRLLLDLYL